MQLACYPVHLCVGVERLFLSQLLLSDSGGQQKYREANSYLNLLCPARPIRTGLSEPRHGLVSFGIGPRFKAPPLRDSSRRIEGNWIHSMCSGPITGCVSVEPSVPHPAQHAAGTGIESPVCLLVNCVFLGLAWGIHCWVTAGKSQMVKK